MQPTTEALDLESISPDLLDNISGGCQERQCPSPPECRPCEPPPRLPPVQRFRMKFQMSYSMSGSQSYFSRSSRRYGYSRSY